MELIFKILRGNNLFLNLLLSFAIIIIVHLKHSLVMAEVNSGYNSWNNNNNNHLTSGADEGRQDKEAGKFCNARFVLDYFRQVFIEKNVEAADNYLSPDYIQHNPSLPDGREALKSAAREWFRRPWVSTVLRHGAAGDLVWIHTRTEADFLREVLGGNGTTAAVDIYRLQDRRIVEHWDVIQLLPDKSANAHPLF